MAPCILSDIIKKFMRDENLDVFIDALRKLIINNKVKLEYVYKRIPYNNFYYIFELFREEFSDKFNRIDINKLLFHFIENRDYQSKIIYILKNFPNCFKPQEIFDKLLNYKSNSDTNFIPKLFVLEKYSDDIIINNDMLHKIAEDYIFVKNLFTRCFHKINTLHHKDILQKFIDHDKNFEELCKYGNEHFLEYILEQDLNFDNNNIDKAFIIACRYNQLTIAKMLKNKFPIINHKEININYEHTLNQEMIYWLMNNCRTNVKSAKKIKN